MSVHLREKQKGDREREGSNASSSSVWMISITLGLCQSAPLDLYMGVKLGFSESWSCPQIRWALSSSQKGSALQKTLSVRFIFNCWLVTIHLPYKIIKLQLQSFPIQSWYIKSCLAREERNIQSSNKTHKAFVADIYYLMTTMTWSHNIRFWLDEGWHN